MSIGTTAAILAGTGIAAAGAIGGGLIQSNSAGNAEQTQANSAAASLAEQQREFNIQQGNEAPWLQAGTTALGQLSAGTAPGGELTAPYSGGTFNPAAFNAPAPFQGSAPFQAPTGLTEQNDPGFQARLKLGQQALEESNAAQGITGGGSEQAAEQYGQTFATNDYQNVYNNALNAYNTNYGTALNTYNTNYNSALQGYQTNYNTQLGAYNTNYNAFEQNQANEFNRLASLSGTGQTAVSGLNQAGQNLANNSTAINTNLGNQTSGLQVGAGNSLSAGLVGAGNATTSGISAYTNAGLLQQLLNNSGYNNRPQALQIAGEAGLT